MKLWKVDVPRPDANGPLRYSIANTDNGHVITIAPGIKLVAKFGPRVMKMYWRQSIEYDGRETVLPQMP